MTKVQCQAEAVRCGREASSLAAVRQYNGAKAKIEEARQWCLKALECKK